MKWDTAIFASVSGKIEGNISKADFLKADSIVLVNRSMQKIMKVKVKSFTLTAIVGSDIYRRSCQGNKIGDEIKAFINKGIPGMKFVLEDIVVENTEGDIWKIMWSSFVLK